LTVELEPVRHKSIGGIFQSGNRVG